MGDETTKLLQEIEEGIKRVTSASVDYSHVQEVCAGTTKEFQQKLVAASKAVAAAANEESKLRKQTERDLIAYERAAVAAAKAADKAAKDQVKAAKEASEAQIKTLDAQQKALGAISSPIQGFVQRAKDMKEAWVTAGETGTRSGLLMSVAAGAVATGALAAAAGVVALGTAIVGVVAKGAEWNEDLRKTNMQVNALASGQLERAAASIDSVGTVAKRIGVDMAVTLSPAVQDASTRIVALGLAAIDGWKNMQQGEGVMDRLATYSGTVLTEALFYPIKPLMTLADGFQNLAKAAGLDTIASGLGSFKEAVNGLKRDQADAVTAALKMLAADGVKPLTAATDAYMGKARALVEAQARANIAGRESTKQAEEHRKKMLEVAQATDPAVKAASDYEAKIKDLKQALKEGYITQAQFASGTVEAWAKVQEAINKVNIKPFKDGLIQSKVASQDVASSIGAIPMPPNPFKTWTSTLSSVNQMAQGVMGSLGKFTDRYASETQAAFQESEQQIQSLEAKIASTSDAAEKKKLQGKLKAVKAEAHAKHEAAVKAFRLQQGLNLAGAVMSTAEAIPKGYAMFGPAGAIAAGLIGAAEIAFIASQSPPTESGSRSGSAPTPKTTIMDDVRSKQSGGEALVSSQPVSTNSMRTQEPSVSVTDAYLPATGKPRTITTAPDDDVYATRSGKLGSSSRQDAALHEKMDRQNRLIEEGNSLTRALIQQLMIRQHVDTVAGPAGKH